MIFNWSESERRYFQDGNPIPDNTLRDWIDQTVEKAQDRIGQLTQDYVNGSINHPEWVLGMQNEIRRGVRGMATLANGGSLSKRQLGYVGQAVKQQFGYLSNFANQLETGEVALGSGAVARAKMYAGGFWGQYQNFARLREKDAGTKYERLVLGVALHCSDCPADAARDWVPIGTLTPIGSRQCLSRCRCHFEYRTNPDQQSAVFQPMTAEQIEDYANSEHWVNWRNNLSEAEKEALLAYSNWDYTEINGYLRGVNDDPLQSSLKHIEGIDSALAKARVDRNLQAYRGMLSPRIYNGFIEETIKVGDIYRDPGYMSTSLDFQRAKDFVNTSEENRVLFRIMVPKDSRAALLADAEVTADPGELELLFPKNSRLKINGIRKRKGVVFVNAILVQE